MNNDYVDALNTVKSVFTGGSETEIWVKALSENIERRDIDLLDVGTGDGVAISKRVGLAKRIGYNICLYGIDKYIPNNSEDPDEIYDMRQEVAYEDYISRKLFDVINFTQSIYYIENVEEAIRKAKEQKRNKGILIITIWKNSCVLQKIKSGFLSGESYTASDIVPLLKKNSLQISRYHYEGSISLEKINESDNIVKKLIRVISRSDNYTCTSKKVQEIRQFLNAQHLRGSRKNEIIIAK